MTVWCVDANVVLTALLPQLNSLVAKAFWDELSPSDTVIAPLVLFPECTSVIRRSVVRGTITESQGYEAVEEMLGLPVKPEPAFEQFRRAFAWATSRKQIKTHDLQCVALADIYGATVVTFDGGVAQAAIEHGVQVRTLQ